MTPVTPEVKTFDTELAHGRAFSFPVPVAESSQRRGQLDAARRLHYVWWSNSKNVWFFVAAESEKMAL